MILRLAELALLACLAIRFISGRWPWVLWPGLFNGSLRVPKDEGRARNLLGVAPDAVREDIIDAHRRLVAQVHPDRGGSNEAVHEANAARDLLLERLGPRNRAGQRG
jgi:DnaJ homolog subfamily C member 19